MILLQLFFFKKKAEEESSIIIIIIIIVTINVIVITKRNNHSKSTGPLRFYSTTYCMYSVFFKFLKVMSSTRGKRSLSRSHQVTIDSDEEDDHSSRPIAFHSNKENRSSSSGSSSNMNTVTHHSLTSHFVPEMKVQQRAEAVIKEKEMHRFEGLSVDAQNLCVKTVVRLFLMKGLNVMIMDMMIASEKMMIVV